jgi:tRNA/rRNA methyltransferase
METLPALDAIYVVLVTPRDATNVGSVVRVMGNFGLRHLRLVEPAAFDVGRTLAVAHRGALIVDSLERYPTLDQAVADCGLVIGTTARPRAVRHEVVPPWQAAVTLLSAARAGNRVALVFGPEDAGLANDALRSCHALSTVPTAPGDASLNLAQAALVHLYELWLAATGAPRPVEGRRGHQPTIAAAVAASEQVGGALAVGTQREEMFRAVEETVWAMHPNNDEGRVRSTTGRLRALLLRAAPRSEEVRLLTTVFTHLAHTLRGGQSPASDEETAGRNGP